MNILHAIDLVDKDNHKLSYNTKNEYFLEDTCGGNPESKCTTSATEESMMFGEVVSPGSYSITSQKFGAARQDDGPIKSAELY